MVMVHSKNLTLWWWLFAHEAHAALNFIHCLELRWSYAVVGAPTAIGVARHAE
jgi:hypothetical protein